MHAFRVARIVSIIPKRTDDACSHSLSARDIKNPRFDTALQERKFSYAGAPSSAGAQKNNKRASTPSNTGDPRGNLKIGRREISRRSPFRIKSFWNEMPYEIAKDLVVNYSDALAKSWVKFPTAKVDEKPPAAASLPIEDPQAALPTLPTNYKYSPDAGSDLAGLLSDPCAGKNCYASVCNLSILQAYSYIMADVVYQS